MTASDPRLGEIQARVRELQEDRAPAAMWRTEDAAYLLAELRDRDEKLARVEALATEWDERWGRYSDAAAALGPQSIRIESAVKAIRAAVAAANGGES